MSRNCNPKSKRFHVSGDLVGIWSWRRSDAWGWYWHLENQVQAYNAGTYLDIFRRDEPKVIFEAASKQPTRPPEHLDGSRRPNYSSAYWPDRKCFVAIVGVETNGTEWIFECSNPEHNISAEPVRAADLTRFTL